MNVGRFMENSGVMSGEFDDQPPISFDKQHALFIQKQLRTIKRFNGRGDAESWLKYIIKKIRFSRSFTRSMG